MRDKKPSLTIIYSLLAALLAASVIFGVLGQGTVCACLGTAALICLAAAVILSRKLSAARRSEHAALQARYDELYERMSLYMRDRVLRRLLVRDGYTAQWERTELDRQGISFPKEKIVVGVLVVDDFPENCDTGDSPGNDGIDQYIYRIIRECATKVYAPTPINAVITARYEGFVLILNYDPGELGDNTYAVKNQLNMYMHTLLDMLEREHSIRVAACMGKEQAGLDGIAASFSAAMDAVEYRSMVGLQSREVEYHLDDASISKYNSMAPVTSYRSLSLERRFISCAEKHDFPMAREALHDMIVNEFDPLPPIGIAKIKLYGILYVVFNTMGSLRLSSNDELWSTLNFDEEIFSTQSIAQMEALIGDIFDRLVETPEESASDSGPEWLGRLVDYINANYRDSGLNINVLADVFDLSPPHISKTFKRYMNIGIADYIQVRRIADAKACLEAGQTVMEAAMNSGFASARTMSRLFVKYEGVTPGKYVKTSDGGTDERA